MRRHFAIFLCSWNKIVIVHFIKVIARLKAIVRRIISKEAVIICALPILETFEIDLTRLLLFGVVDTLAQVRKVVVALELVHQIELQSPNDIGSVLNVAGFFETLERNGMSIVGAIETAYNDESGIGVALKFLELANRIINAQLC